MLVLSRKKDESIVVGDDIEIVVVDVRKGRVRLGIKAPRDVIVDRKEVRLKKEGKNESEQKKSVSDDNT